MKRCFCGRPSGNRSMCDAHRKRKQQSRESTRPIRKYVRGFENRLLAHSQRQGECLIWRGMTNIHGYGRINVGGKKRAVHRAAYEHWVGPIPDGMQIDHICCIRACIEPSHLAVVTSQQNFRRVRLSRDTSNGRFLARPIGKHRQSTNQDEYHSRSLGPSDQ